MSINVNDNCQQIKVQFPDYLTGDIESGAKESIKNHVVVCDACRQELEELSSTWTQLGILPEEQPGPHLRKNFYTMLESYQEGKESKALKKFFQFFKIKNVRETLWTRRPGFAFQFALALFFLVTGIGIGYFFQTSAQKSHEIVSLRQENQQVRQQLAISLLNQSSSSQRLKGLTFSAHLENPDSEILETLLNTLNSDPNVNVRLSAVDALYLFADHPLVREGLIQSLHKQTSPMVQLALIDLMVQIREKQAVRSLKQLLKDKNLNPEVQRRARLSIKQLL
ncbi:MAG: hypothetical protein GTO45_33580 [Candidatus Aminicenantes bacterium]|nr:hypothetical protein [Candidatus Aminicenantes bacterium]NIM83641.1 hypothetical protein [Candidatus Aminicenantes bacterium]NIN23065.1 hypothetical protein [Candidatus Aminicenantes bacterium]NIN46792.1 hypothetical protein [Candidatus Aminicenantes bacterium]NIN89714.1 hypothetical protein [Candidatus Aminicenantes bacterium]